MLTLENFTEIIDNEILKRGREYQRAGNVINLDADEEGWSATVVGTYDYNVEIVRLPDGTLEADCDCPYDWGPYCKHIAAVFWALREQPPKARKKSTSTAQSVQQVVAGLTHEQLVEIVMSQIKGDRALGNQILLKYGQAAPNKALFVRTINDVVRKYDDHGFLDYMGSRRAGKELQGLVAQAASLVENQQYDRALIMLQAVIETVPQHLNSADDSSGDVSGSIDYALNVLEDLARDADTALQEMVFDYCLEQFNQPKYRDWGDYQERLLWQAGEITNSQSHRDRLYATLDRFIDDARDERFGNYRAEHALQIKQDLMQRMGASPHEIEQLLLTNTHLDRPRKALIDRYIEQGNLSAARDLCLAGIQQSRANGWPGLVADYEDKLLAIAKKDNDPQAVINMAEKLLFDGRDFDYYYNTLRDYIPKSDWSQAVQRIIGVVKKETSHWQQAHTLGRIYEREGMWTDLFDLAKQQPGTRMIEEYRSHFHEHFPDEMCDLYEATVRGELRHTTGRDHYRTMAALLERIIELGQPDRAGAIIEELIAEYPKRRAMVEELNKVSAR